LILAWWFRFSLLNALAGNWVRTGIGKVYGQENITTYNLCLYEHAIAWKDTEFEIHHGDSWLNDWDILNEMNPARWSLMLLSCKPPIQLSLGAN